MALAMVQVSVAVTGAHKLDRAGPCGCGTAFQSPGGGNSPLRLCDAPLGGAEPLGGAPNGAP